jgi:hypothetical protein
MKNALLLLALVITLFSCKKNEPKIETKTVTETESKIVETFQDTVVNIKPVKPIEIQDSISTEKATQTLYAHFKSKGFLTQDEIEKKPSIQWLPKNKNKNVIEFSELLFFNKQFAVITYYNAAIGAIGHCVQPHLALISNSVNGLAISNEEFLPPNFTIDSLKIENNKPIIYSRDYNCYNNEFLKKYRIELKN